MLSRLGLLSLCGAVSVAIAAPAQADQLSESSARKIMEYAWALVPEQYTPPSGETIKIDKTKKDEIMIPLEDAREIIRVGRMSAHAQRCELIEEKILNYRSLMKREMDKKKWTDQQMVFISQLHLTTVMLMNGKVTIIEKQGDKQVQLEDSKAKASTCTDEQKTKVNEIITAYVKAGPDLNIQFVPSQTGSTKPASSAQ